MRILTESHEWGCPPIAGGLLADVGYVRNALQLLPGSPQPERRQGWPAKVSVVPYRPCVQGVWVRVSKDDVICGVSAAAARQLMRAYFDEHTAAVACEVLRVDRDAAHDQLRGFEAAGYIERSQKDGMADDWWATTIQGNALAQASFGKPISRATAARHLTQVIERARGYNADPDRLLTITQIAVFGSYLDPVVDRLGDLDLAVSAVRRETNGDRYVEKVLAYARASERRFAMFTEELFWPARELRMILKNQSSAISITDEDISKLTDRFEIVYTVGDDLGAIPPPADAMTER